MVRPEVKFLRFILLAGLLASCEKETFPETKPTTYVFSPKHAAPTPTPAPSVAVVRPTPTPAVKSTGWIQVQADRWQRATVRPEKAHFVAAIAGQIERNRPRYEAVGRASGVPWQIIGAIHSLEASLDFRCNLANGDPLTAPTRHVPRGHPLGAHFPVSWEAAAIDALNFDDMGKKQWFFVGNALQNTELYNGPFYENHNLVSPYNHSFDNLYERGKIIADGHYSPTAISQQCGIVPILKALRYE